MKIIQKPINKNTSEIIKDEIIEPKRNVTNVFDISKIVNQLQRYNISVTFESPRWLNNELRMIIMQSKYRGRVNDLTRTPKPATIALIVDYENETAMAMPRSGSDKQTMLLMSSVANKYINEPFTYDSDIRFKITDDIKK